MILWLKRTTILATAACFVALFWEANHPQVMVLAVTLHLLWLLDERFPPPLRQRLADWLLTVDTVLAAYGVWAAPVPGWAVLIGAGSLLSWNTGLFLRSQPQPSRQRRSAYLRRVGILSGVGIGLAFTALYFQGHVVLSFAAAILAMISTGLLYLDLLSDPS